MVSIKIKNSSESNDFIDLDIPSDIEENINENLNQFFFLGKESTGILLYLQKKNNEIKLKGKEKTNILIKINSEENFKNYSDDNNIKKNVIVESKKFFNFFFNKLKFKNSPITFVYYHENNSFYQYIDNNGNIRGFGKHDGFTETKIDFGNEYKFFLISEDYLKLFYIFFKNKIKLKISPEDIYDEIIEDFKKVDDFFGFIEKNNIIELNKNINKLLNIQNEKVRKAVFNFIFLNLKKNYEFSEESYPDYHNLILFLKENSGMENIENDDLFKLEDAYFNLVSPAAAEFGQVQIQDYYNNLAVFNQLINQEVLAGNQTKRKNKVNEITKKINKSLIESAKKKIPKIIEAIINKKELITDFYEIINNFEYLKQDEILEENEIKELLNDFGENFLKKIKENHEELMKHPISYEKLISYFLSMNEEFLNQNIKTLLNSKIFLLKPFFNIEIYSESLISSIKLLKKNFNLINLRYFYSSFLSFIDFAKKISNETELENELKKIKSEYDFLKEINIENIYESIILPIKEQSMEHIKIIVDSWNWEKNKKIIKAFKKIEYDSESKEKIAESMNAFSEKFEIAPNYYFCQLKFFEEIKNNEIKIELIEEFNEKFKQAIEKLEKNHLTKDKNILIESILQNYKEIMTEIFKNSSNIKNYFNFLLKNFEEIKKINSELIDIFPEKKDVLKGYFNAIYDFIESDRIIFNLLKKTSFSEDEELNLKENLDSISNHISSFKLDLFENENNKKIAENIIKINESYLNKPSQIITGAKIKNFEKINEYYAEIRDFDFSGFNKIINDSKTIFENISFEIDLFSENFFNSIIKKTYYLYFLKESENEKIENIERELISFSTNFNLKLISEKLLDYSINEYLTIIDLKEKLIKILKNIKKAYNQYFVFFYEKKKLKLKTNYHEIFEPLFVDLMVSLRFCFIFLTVDFLKKTIFVFNRKKIIENEQKKISEIKELFNKMIDFEKFLPINKHVLFNENYEKINERYKTKINNFFDVFIKTEGTIKNYLLESFSYYIKDLTNEKSVSNLFHPLIFKPKNLGFRLGSNEIENVYQKLLKSFFSENEEFEIIKKLSIQKNIDFGKIDLQIKQYLNSKNFEKRIKKILIEYKGFSLTISPDFKNKNYCLINEEKKFIDFFTVKANEEDEFKINELITSPTHVIKIKNNELTIESLVKKIKKNPFIGYFIIEKYKKNTNKASICFLSEKKALFLPIKEEIILGLLDEYSSVFNHGRIIKKITVLKKELLQAEVFSQKNINKMPENGGSNSSIVFESEEEFNNKIIKKIKNFFGINLGDIDLQIKNEKIFLNFLKNDETAIKQDNEIYNQINESINQLIKHLRK